MTDDEITLGFARLNNSIHEIATESTTMKEALDAELTVLRAAFALLASNKAGAAAQLAADITRPVDELFPGMHPENPRRRRLARAAEALAERLGAVM